MVCAYFIYLNFFSGNFWFIQFWKGLKCKKKIKKVFFLDLVFDLYIFEKLVTRAFQRNIHLSKIPVLCRDIGYRLYDIFWAYFNSKCTNFYGQKLPKLWSCGIFFGIVILTDNRFMAFFGSDSLKRVKCST